MLNQNQNKTYYDRNRQESTTFDATISDLGIKNTKIHWNLSPEKLSEIAVEKGQATITSSGAININTGEFTGRSPMDRFIVKDSITENSVWWGDVNLSFDKEKFNVLQKKILDYLSNKEIYVRDSFACADPKYKMNIRVINEYAWSNLFAYNMFLRPTEEELENFTPEWIILNSQDLWQTLKLMEQDNIILTS